MGAGPLLFCYLAPDDAPFGWCRTALSITPGHDGAAESFRYFQYQVMRPMKIENVHKELDEPFSRALLRLIDASGMTDAQVYKRANIDRRLFSKIHIGAGYHPSKRTALALAIALELKPDAANDLLAKAGYSLSKSQLVDVVVAKFINCNQFDISKINEALYQLNQKPLGR